MSASTLNRLALVFALPLLCAQTLSEEEVSEAEKKRIMAEEMYDRGEEAVIDEQKIRYYKKAVKYNPKHAASWFRLGWHYQKMNLRKYAQRYYTRCIELEPGHYSAYNNLGNIYSDWHQFSKAEEHFKKAMQLKPDYPLAPLNLANHYRAQKKYSLAEQYYRRVLKLEPDNFWARLNLGAVLIRMVKMKDLPFARLSEAESLLLKAAADKPDFVPPRIQLGYVYEMRGDEHEALRHWYSLMRSLPPDSRYADLVKNRISMLQH